MKYSTVLAVAFASLVSAQSASELVAQLPSCVGTCLTDAAEKAGCGATDYACQCGEKYATISVDATPCVLGACSTGEAGRKSTVIP